MKSGNLNFLEPSGPLQACNGTAFLGMDSSNFLFYLQITNLTNISLYTWLFQFCTCFEQHRAHHQDNKLYQNDICHVTLCRWPSGMQIWMERSSIHTCKPDGHLHRVTYTRCRFDTTYCPDDEHGVARNMYRIEITMYIKKCSSSWLFTRIISRGTVNRI